MVRGTCPAGKALQQGGVNAEQGSDEQDEPAPDAAADFDAAAHAATVLHLRWVQLDVVIEAHEVTIALAGAAEAGPAGKVE